MTAYCHVAITVCQQGISQNVTLLLQFEHKPVLCLWHHDGTEGCIHASLDISGFACPDASLTDAKMREDDILKDWEGLDSQLMNESGNEMGVTNDNLILLLSLFQCLVLLIIHLVPFPFRHAVILP